MEFSFVTTVQALVIALAISLDAFVASFAYASKGIKIPLRSAWMINLICTAMTGAALLAGNMLAQYIPYALTVAISFIILFALGILKLMDSITKSIIRKFSEISKEIKFSLLNFRFILRLYADPEKADTDGSKVLSTAEAASLALALSLDGLAVGLGAAIGNANWLIVLGCTLVIGIIALLTGARLGNKAAQKIRINLSWLSGVLLILLAFSRLW